jgi:hypothetical protein
MKNTIYIFLALAFMMACGTATRETAEVVIELPESSQEDNYSGSFEMGDNANYAIVRQWNEGIVAGDADKLASLLADSVAVYVWDGMIFNTTRDSLMTIVKGMMGSINDLEIISHAGMAINSTDQGDAWALSWATEQYTDAEGKPMRINFQENWLIEKGKARTIRQYAQLVPEDAPPMAANNETEFSYSGSWVAADNSLTEAVLGWNNALATPTDLETAASFLADSVTVYMWDGTVIDGTKDSVMSFVKEFVSGAASVTVEFDAIMAVHSTDRNSDVVMSWTEERWTDTEGNVEHMWIHEDYIMENGKIRMVQQYAMKEPPK